MKTAKPDRKCQACCFCGVGWRVGGIIPAESSLQGESQQFSQRMGVRHSLPLRRVTDPCVGRDLTMSFSSNPPLTPPPAPIAFRIKSKFLSTAHRGVCCCCLVFVCFLFLNGLPTWAFLVCAQPIPPPRHPHSAPLCTHPFLWELCRSHAFRLSAFCFSFPFCL